MSDQQPSSSQGYPFVPNGYADPGNSNYTNAPAVHPDPAHQHTQNGNTDQQGFDVGMNDCTTKLAKVDKCKRKADAESDDDEFMPRKFSRVRSNASVASLGGVSVFSSNRSDSARSSFASTAEGIGGTRMGPDQTGPRRLGSMEVDPFKRGGADVEMREHGGDLGERNEAKAALLHDANMQRPKKKATPRNMRKSDIFTTRSAKRQLNKHQPYACVEPDGAQKKRDNYINLIAKHWPDTTAEACIPAQLHPHRLPIDLRDWTTELTQWLSELAGITQGDMRRAHRFITEETNGGAVGWEDVKRAFIRCEHANGYEQGRGEGASSAVGSNSTDSVQGIEDHEMKNGEDMDAKVPVDFEMEDADEEVDRTKDGEGLAHQQLQAWARDGSSHNGSTDPGTANIIYPHGRPSHEGPGRVGDSHHRLSQARPANNATPDQQHHQPHGSFVPPEIFVRDAGIPPQMQFRQPPAPPPAPSQANANSPYPRPPRALPAPAARLHQHAGTGQNQQQGYNQRRHGPHVEVDIDGDFE